MIHSLKGSIDTRQVWLDGKELKPARSQKIRNHSPDGFNWGYSGSGPAQLALAIVLELKDNIINYQYFKWDFVAQLPQGDSFEVQFDDEIIIKQWRQDEQIKTTKTL